MISDDDLRLWIKPVEDEELEVLRRLEKAAVAACQKITGRYLGPLATVVEIITWRGWPLSLGNEPVGGVVTSVEEWSNGAWSVASASGYSLHGSFVHSESTAYTSATNPVRYRVTYQAGYTQLDDPNAWAAPDDIQQAVLFLVGHWYENREAVIVGPSASEVPLTAHALLSNHARMSV